jgi:hypothetical protein
VAEAEDNLLIGSKNPLGNFESPKYRVAFDQNSVNYNYASAWENNGTVITEMTTQQEISIIDYSKLGPFSYYW